MSPILAFLREMWSSFFEDQDPANFVIVASRMSDNAQN